MTADRGALPSKVSGRRPGPLGMFCLIAFIVGPFAGWMIAGKAMGPFTEQSWLWRLGLRATLGVAWPVIAAIAHGYAARHVWGVRFLWPPLVVSVLVAALSVNAVLDLARGPVVNEVRVAGERTVVGGGRGSPITRSYRLVLDDGTEVVTERTGLRRGARARLRWLASTEVALRVEPLPRAR